MFSPTDVQPETFGKRPKRKNSPVVRLLPGSHERLALRNPRVLCQKQCQGYKKRDKKLDSSAADKSAKKLVSSNVAKIQEVATKIRETCEKTLFTPPSPINATNSIVSV